MKPIVKRGGIAARVHVFALAALFIVVSVFGPDEFAKSEGAWSAADFSQVRMIGGRRLEGGKEQVFAGVEIVLAKNWKTYWISPGDAGGVPPRFDWSELKNVASVEVMYPAPQRFKDFGGATVGYKDLVIFPIRIVPERSGEPIELNFDFSYGICSTICVPVTKSLAISIPPGGMDTFPQALREAIARVPREGVKRLEKDPRLSGYRVNLEGAKPEIVFDVDFAGYPSGGDVFVEVSGDMYLPMTRFRRDKPGRFVINLSRVKDREKLRGKVLRITLVSDMGQSVDYLKID